MKKLLLLLAFITLAVQASIRTNDTTDGIIGGPTTGTSFTTNTGDIKRGLDVAVVVGGEQHFFDMSRGLIIGSSVQSKFGNNDDIDIGTPEDVWNGGGNYTGQPVSGVETVNCFSSSAADTSAGTGARTIRISGLDGATSLDQSEDLILNGTTAVTSVNTYSRLPRAIVLTAGSGATNAGTITCRHTTTTANVFLVMPIGSAQTAVQAFTIPLGKTGYIKRVRLTMSRSNGSAGSGIITIRVRELGGVYRAVRRETKTTNSPIQFDLIGSIVLPALTDVKVRVDSVSDNNTQISAAIDYILIDD